MDNKFCSKCAVDPASHSFRKISEKNGCYVFYTNPSKAKDKDTDSILNHFNLALEKVGNKRWLWVFDGDGFETEHALEIRTGQGIAALINEKYGNNLEEIRIINPTVHIKLALKVMGPFMSDLLKSKIRLLDDRVYSVLEFM